MKTNAFVIAVAAATTLAPLVARADEKAECVSASEKAQSLKDDRKFIKAREQMLVCARDVCPAAVKKDCADQVADLDKRTPTVVLHVKDKGGQDLVAVKVTADGAAITEQLDGRAITLDPGVHTFRFEAAGNDALEQKIVLAEGERDRNIIVSFGKGNDQIATPAKKSVPIGAFIVAGIGLVGMGVGGAFWGIGLGQKSDLEAGGSTHCAPNCTADQVNTVHTSLVVGDIAFFAGTAILAAGLIWTIVHYASGPSNKEASALLDVATGTIRW